MFLPIYQGHPATIEKRRQRLVGFVLGVFRIGDLFSRSIDHTAADGINLTLLDGTTSPEQTLATHTVSKEKELHSVIAYSRQLATFGGRTWSLFATPSSGYVAQRRSALPFIIFLFGALFVTFVTACILLVLRRSALIEQTVRDRTEELNDAKEELERLSLTDGLTGLANRRYFDIHLENEWARAVRGKQPIALMMIDVDQFKAFNDSYGHLAGDKCLKEVARALNLIIKRPSDFVARYGGEEFSIVLPNTDDAVFLLAESCRKKLSRTYTFRMSIPAWPII